MDDFNEQFRQQGPPPYGYEALQQMLSEAVNREWAAKTEAVRLQRELIAMRQREEQRAHDEMAVQVQADHERNEIEQREEAERHAREAD